MITVSDIERLAGRVDIVADHSWPSQDRAGSATTVLQVRTTSGDAIIKQHTDSDLYQRELHVLTHWAPALGDRAPRLLDADHQQQTMLLTLLPGRPLSALGLPPREEREAYRQAGELLQTLHQSQPLKTLPNFGRERAAYLRTQLSNGTHILTPEETDFANQALKLLEELPPQQAQPSHLDFTSRNILWDGKTASLLDFETSRYEALGRDFLRITQRTLRDDQDLRSAFYTGYGREPNSTERKLMRICGAADAAALTVTASLAGQTALATESHRALNIMLSGLHD